MKNRISPLFVLALIILLLSCKQKAIDADVNIIFLHHSTGSAIWNGKNSVISKVVKRFSKTFAEKIGFKGYLPKLFKEYGREQNKNYLIEERTFPKNSPYGWHNYPYDYYNIWVRNAGNNPFMEEPTLEILTEKYQVIIFKHCFPVTNIQSDMDSADINSDLKTLSNYKLQYLALKEKLHEFPVTKFILFTGATQVKANITEEEAKRAKEFFEWVIQKWDLPGDNIYLWDLYGLQTDGELYFNDENARSESDSHPNEEFAEKAAKLLFNRIIDIIETDGTRTKLTGEVKY